MGFCASCDQCRSRKTRCDGKKPCGTCKLKYMRKHKLSNVDGIDASFYDCVYSPARRRGPVPGVNNKQPDDNLFCSLANHDGDVSVTSTQSSKAHSMRSSKEPSGQEARGDRVGAGVAGMTMTIASAMTNADVNGWRIVGNETDHREIVGNNNNFPLPPPLDPRAAVVQDQVLSTLGSIGNNNLFNLSYPLLDINRSGGGGYYHDGGWQQQQQQEQDIIATAQNSAQKQLAYVQLLQLQQQIQMQKHRRSMNAVALSASQGSNGSSGSQNSLSNNLIANETMVGGCNGRFQLRSTVPIHAPRVPSSVGATATTSRQRAIGCLHPKVLQYLPLTNSTNPSGMHLRACYTLSFGGLFGLSTVPTDEDYCRRFAPLEPYQLPKFDVAALQAARFAELAMGALTMIKHGEMEFVVALANASVLCLQTCVEEQVHPCLILDIARIYFFHSTLRLYIGDMERYFKYRRVCLRYLSQLDGISGVNSLMAAISFQDSLVYMTYNASEDFVPNIDGDIPRIGGLEAMSFTDTEKKYGIGIKPSRVASNPMNQIWIQGTPPVFVNERAPSRSRVLDALACALRSDVDCANSRQTKDQTRTITGSTVSRKRKFLSDAVAKDKSATEWAVENHQDELSISNLLAEASDLLSMSSLLAEASDLLSSNNKHPSLPSDSIFCGLRLLVTAMNAILNTKTNSLDIESLFDVLESVIERPILLHQGGPTYHIINSCTIRLAHKINTLQCNDLDNMQFQKALSVYNGSRMMLEKHRGKLPQRLRCCELPIPNHTQENGRPMIDLSGVSLCMSHNFQNFNDATERASILAVFERGIVQTSKSEELDINDTALLTVLSRVISKELEI